LTQPCIPVIFAAAFRNLKLAGRAAAGDVSWAAGMATSGAPSAGAAASPADHAGSAGGGSALFFLASFSLTLAPAWCRPVSAASFLRSLRAPVALLAGASGASAAGAAGCDHGSAGGLAGGTSVEAALSGKAGDCGAPKGSALVGVSIQGSDDAEGVAQGSGSVGLAGLTMGSAGGAAIVGLPGAAATKGSAGAEAPAQGSSELSATSAMAPYRVRACFWAACYRLIRACRQPVES